MYKLLLCWRYLLTRYLALACIISVMLGVATLIVVNSVMGGFSTKLARSAARPALRRRDRGPQPGRFRRSRRQDEPIRQIRLGDRIVAMAPTLEVFAMLQFR